MTVSSSVIAEAAQILAHGGLVAFPTETVYGLGADATNPEAVARIFAVKGRPAFNPLIAHVNDAHVARILGVFDDYAYKLAAAFWPGPLTLVVAVASECAVCDLALAGLSTIALRVPSHPTAQALLSAFGGPVVAPSANRSGHVSPTTAQHVRDDLGEAVDLIIDDGPTLVGLESTIVACLGGSPRLLRSGAVARTAIEYTLGESLLLAPAPGASPQAPGMLASHYAPRTPLRLDATEVFPGEALLTFGSHTPRGSAQAEGLLNLSPSGDVIEAAAHLYAHLRALDRLDAKAIAIAPIPHEGLGEAIRDRLLRAAARD